MNIKEKKLKIKNLKAFYMDDWELTEEQKDQLDALATDILNVGIEQGKLESSANREGYKLVPVDDINIADIIWGKCPCGSSRSPIVSDREGYNLIHCFACGANKYIHEDY